MFDFKLTKKGDLDLDYGDDINSVQKVSFVVSDYEAQRIRFVTMPLAVQPKKPAEQRVSFKLADIEDTSFVEKSIQDEDELMQAVYLALRTESGDVYDRNVGTVLYKLRHMVVRDEAELKQLAVRIASIVNKVVPGADIELLEEEYPDAGFFRYQSFVIRILLGDRKILELPLL